MSINTSLVIILALSVVTMSIPGAFVVSDTLIQGGYTQVEQGKLGAVAIEN